MIISVVGHGYVGLVTAAVFADLGNTVWVLGRDPKKIEELRRGKVPFYEPGLEETVKRGLKNGYLKFTLSYSEAISPSEVIFIAVGTPGDKNGEADLSNVFIVAKKIARHITGYKIVATKSTVPPGTNQKIEEIMEKEKEKTASFDIASTPEFLSQGTALDNTLHPDRVVIGTKTQKAREILVRLHEPIDGEMILTNVKTAEMIKYAANAMLATRISFANLIALLSEQVGADALTVLKGVGLDKRIGKTFLSPGVGFGGSCLPKDTKALVKITQKAGVISEFFEAIIKVNEEVRKNFIQKIKKALGSKPQGKTIAILGLSFKPDTDDMREAPSIYIIKALQNLGVKIRAYDPKAMEKAEKILSWVTFLKDPYQTCSGSDILVVLTEWNEFKELDLLRVKELLKKPVVFDGRNIYNPEKLRELGFIYQGVGR